MDGRRPTDRREYDYRVRFTEQNGHSVLERAFRLLQVFDNDSANLGLAELSRQADLPKATAFRLANQLVELGALERSASGYRLGMRLFELGSMVFTQRRLRDAALPLMEDLYEATHETVHLAILDGLRVLYVEKIEGRTSVTTPTQIGTRRPLHCTALGKAILANSEEALMRSVIDAGLTRFTPYTITSPQRLKDELEIARREGVAYDREEFQLGVMCVSAALPAYGNAVDAALSVTGFADRFNAERQATAVRTAALAISRLLARPLLGPRAS